jgi:WD40 repeat protein
MAATRVFKPKAGINQLPETHAGLNFAVSPSWTTLAMVDYERNIRLWDVESGGETLTLSGHDGLVNGVAFSPNGLWLASGSRDKTIKLWNAATGEPVRTLAGHRDLVGWVVFSPDGTKLASTSPDKTLRIWSVESGNVLQVKEYASAVASPQFSPDGNSIAVAGLTDRTVHIHRLAEGAEAIVLRGHKDFVSSIAYSPDGTKIASGSWDKSVMIWDTTTGQLLKRLGDHRAGVTNISFSPDGQLLAVGTQDGALQLWDLDSSSLKLKISALARFSISGLTFSPDGKTLAMTSGTTVSFWDLTPSGLKEAAEKGKRLAEQRRAAFAKFDCEQVAVLNDLVSGRPEHAQCEFEKALSSDDPQQLYSAAREQLLRINPHRAKRLLEKIIENHPSYARLAKSEMQNEFFWRNIKPAELWKDQKLD